MRKGPPAVIRGSMLWAALSVPRRSSSAMSWKPDLTVGGSRRSLSLTGMPVPTGSYSATAWAMLPGACNGDRMQVAAMTGWLPSRWQPVPSGAWISRACPSRVKPARLFGPVAEAIARPPGTAWMLQCSFSCPDLPAIDCPYKSRHPAVSWRRLGDAGSALDDVGKPRPGLRPTPQHRGGGLPVAHAAAALPGAREPPLSCPGAAGLPR